MAKVAKLTNLSASGLVKTGAGQLEQIIVTSHTSGVIKMYDYLTGTSTVLIPSITLGASEREITFKGVPFAVGLYFELTSGTASVSILYN
jgi:hypothetical protein